MQPRVANHNQGCLEIGQRNTLRAGVGARQHRSDQLAPHLIREVGVVVGQVQVHLLAHDVLGRVSVTEVLSARPDFEQNSAQGIYVRAPINRLVGLLLRRPVSRRAGLIFGSQCRAAQMSHTKIAEFHLGIICQEDILRLYIPVYDVQGVNLGKRFTQVQSPAHGEPEIRMRVGPQVLVETPRRH